MQLSIDRRLAVLAEAQRRVTLVINDPESLPTELLNAVLALTANTGLRLLLIGQPVRDERCKALTTAAGLGWQELGNTHNTHHRKLAGLAALGGLAIVGSGLWYGAQQDSPKTTAFSPPLASKTVSRPIVSEPSLPAATPSAVDHRAPTKKLVEASTATLPPKPTIYPAGTRYTVQIASYSRADFRKEFMRKTGKNLPELRSVDIIEKDGNRKMVVAYGAYTGYEAASKAANNLPQSVNLGSPYIIPVSDAMVGPSQEHSD